VRERSKIEVLEELDTFAMTTVRRTVTVIGYGQRWPIQQRLLGVSASYRF
jgi:hypothetical protein